MNHQRHSPVEIEATAPHLCTIASRLEILARLPFFKDLSEADLIKVNEMFHQKDFTEDAIIYLSGDPADHLYVVAEGRVKLLQHSLTGKEILLDLLTPGCFSPDHQSLSGSGGESHRYHGGAVTGGK
jgi:signal-transduction protein with cAMP-binding, CBS, and nucleotidyltransferase domain